ncbi:MAG: hypothetical protein WD066_07010 [Planctomycetaceae bacterium]
MLQSRSTARMALIACLLSRMGGPTHADPPTEAATALPKDGAWTRYHVVIKTIDGNHTTEETAKCTFAFLGQAVHESTACRWIELSMTHDKSETTRVKCLVREKDLQESERPFEHVLKCQLQGSDGTIIDADDQTARSVGVHAVFLPGTVKAARKLDEPQTVKYQQGNLEIATGSAGRYILADGDGTLTADYSIWMHSDVPVGFAYAKFKLDSTAAGEELSGSFEYFLEETGIDAKPSF